MDCPDGARLVPLTQGKFAIVDEEDYEISARFPWYIQNTRRSSYAICKMYIGSIGGKSCSAYMSLHRLIMRPASGMDIDHLNHNGLDCRKKNMRICTRQQNACNRRSNRQVKEKSSLYKGVSWHKRLRQWQSGIAVNKRDVHLGYFDLEIDAAKAYDRVAIAHFGEFAHTNFPKEDYL